MGENPVFKLAIPTAVEGIPSELLDPEVAWSDKSGYKAQVEKLAGMFNKAFERYANECAPEVVAAGPPPLHLVVPCSCALALSVSHPHGPSQCHTLEPARELAACLLLPPSLPLPYHPVMKQSRALAS